MGGAFQICMLGIKFFSLAGLMKMSLKSFITQDDKKVINRVLFETEKFKKQEKYALLE